jgi:uncharacterized protein YjbI with pentapeptide repeats
MANQEQLDLLKKGVQAWNAWREQNPSITPDLSDAWLQDFDFSGANFQGANLTNATFQNATLPHGMRNEMTNKQASQKRREIFFQGRERGKREENA